MFKLDDNFLVELGLGSLPVEDKKAMLNHIYETLEMRVGMKLAEQMTNEQLDEFEGFIQRNDEPGALNWLESNFPNYKQVVADELEKLKGEIKTAAPQILAAAGQQGQATPAAPSYAQPAVDPYAAPQQFQPTPQPTAAMPQYPPAGVQATQYPAPQPLQPMQQAQAQQPYAAPADPSIQQPYQPPAPQMPTAQPPANPQYPQPPLPPQSPQF